VQKQQLQREQLEQLEEKSELLHTQIQEREQLLLLDRLERQPPYWFNYFAAA
jgi:hypothetical protein